MNSGSLFFAGMRRMTAAVSPRRAGSVSMSAPDPYFYWPGAAVCGRGASGPGKLIAAVAPANALHQAPATQEAHQLVHVRLGQAFAGGDLGRGDRAPLLPSDLEQATKPVFFLCCEPHRYPPGGPSLTRCG